ncbi:MAG: diphthine--ammonia ligase [Halobacteria archaeon]|nr:diphthine--ammonia ligase [Halobacteria archaeon]
MTSKPSACALFSGGKDSTYALYLALQNGYNIDTLLTVHADEGSYMYHVPAVELTRLGAEAMGMSEDLVTIEADLEDEIAPLRDELAEIAPDAVVTGAVESEYQKSRIDAVCDELGAESIAPLWHADPVETLREITDEFEVVITAVAADGLDETWLGRTIDTEAIKELVRLRDERGVHPMGEGGEFETLVVAGSHMNGRINLEYEKEWDGMRGSLKIKNAELS